MRLLLVEDHVLFRSAMRSLLAHDPEFEVVGEAREGQEALELVPALKPDVVILDVAMRERNGVETARDFAKRHPQVKVVMVTGHRDPQLARDCLRARAHAVVARESSFESLRAALQAVARGEAYLSPGLWHSETAAARKPAPPGKVLTPREREVLQLVAEGKSAKEIGAILLVSSRTVENHRQHIVEKLGIHTTAELVKYAIRHGLTRPD